jgi:3-methylcrotonyl-CoA carboxylase beta subunit
MSDEALIVDKTGSIFLAGPYLVKAAIGEDVDKETLGGASTQSEISGVTDYKMPDDKTCLTTIRDLVSKMGRFERTGFDRIAPLAPARDGNEILALMAENNTKPYDTQHLLECICDKDSITYYKEGYGKTIICAYARVDGWSVGIVVNQRKVVLKTPKAKCSLEALFIAIRPINQLDLS